MDHLPQVVGSIATPPIVPCVCDPTDFDSLEFESFPTRRGFHLVSQYGWPKLILNADRSRPSPQALAEIAQSWLFFGLLIAVLKVSGVSVNTHDFVIGEGEDKHITMKALPAYLAEWERNEGLLSKLDRKAHFRRQQHMIMIQSCFRLYQLTGQFWGPRGLLPDLFERPGETYKVALPLYIHMSITILEETLDRASRRAFGNLDKSSTAINIKDQNLMNELMARAWCPSEISLVQEGMDDTSAFFASQIDRRRLKADHLRCSRNKCLAFNVVTQQYQTKHAADCAGCQDLGINSSELTSILRQGQTPRAYIRLGGSCDVSPLELKIGVSGSYVAISHVWSDGLGNPHTNSLPTCQLLRLYRMAAALDVGFAEGVAAIWIDSLLVPVERGNDKKLALTRLCDYYKEAHKVLVLDSDLLHASQACSEEEILARILFSTWMRRLWTLEEGILSRDNLVFQFRDGIVSASIFTNRKYSPASITPIGEVLCDNMTRFLPNLGNYYRQPSVCTPRGSPVIAKLLPILEYRSTTKAIDESLCIAHILGLDPSRLLLTDNEHVRMKIFVGMLAEQENSFPTRFLFTKEPKLPFDGLRWAPTSFMALDHEDIAYLSGDYSRLWAGCSDKGLLIHGMSGFALPFGRHAFKRELFVEADKKIYGLTPVPAGRSCRDAGRFWSPQSLDEPYSFQHWNTEIREILGGRPHSFAVLWLESTFGLLVLMYDFVGKAEDSDGSLIYARPLGQVYMQELKTPSQNHSVTGADSDAIRFTNPDWDFEETERQMHEALDKTFDPESSTFLRCRPIDPCQRWCVG